MVETISKSLFLIIISFLKLGTQEQITLHFMGIIAEYCKLACTSYLILTGEKPYACEYCPEKFYRDLSSMHNQRHHGHPHYQYKIVTVAETS